MSKNRHRRELLELSRQIIAIDSRNSRGNVQLARFVGARLEGLGFKVQYQRAKLGGVSQVNLTARIGPDRTRPLIINTHLDTVETHPVDWTKTGGDPFRATIRHGRLYGLGSADTKLALACQLIALAGIDLERLSRPLLISGTYGEELGLVGVGKLVSTLKLRQAYVLNSEPTELRACNANFGFRIYLIEGRSDKRVEEGVLFKLKFSGKAAHSAFPERGENAIDRALHWLHTEGAGTKLVTMEGGLAANIVAPSCQLSVLNHNHQLKGLRRLGGEIVNKRPAQVSTSVSSIQSFLTQLPAQLLVGHSARERSNLGKVKLSAGQLELIFSHRFNYQVEPDVRLGQWRKFVKGQSSPRQANFTITIMRDNPAFHQDTSSRLLREVRAVLKTMGRSTQLVKKLGCTESSIFAQAGAEVITIGPGTVYGNAHEPNESVEVEQLEQAVEFYRSIIEKICF